MMMCKFNISMSSYKNAFPLLLYISQRLWTTDERLKSPFSMFFFILVCVKEIAHLLSVTVRKTEGLSVKCLLLPKIKC